MTWSHPKKTAVREALKTVRRAEPFSALTAGHRRWWHDYYRHGFLSIPDTRLQDFCWIQLYRIASAARKEAPVMATCGPWLEPTPWPATWWGELQRRYIQPNTMYKESGPVIETPLFPAVPAKWADAALRDFRTEGAFLLSASRQRRACCVRTWTAS